MTTSISPEQAAALMTCAQRLRTIRKSRHLTLQQVGKLLGVTKQRVAQYEKGPCNPSIVLLVKLADVYGVSIDYLVGQVEAPDEFAFRPDTEAPAELSMAAATTTSVPVGIHMEVAARKLRVAGGNVQRAIDAMELIRETLLKVADMVPNTLGTPD